MRELFTINPVALAAGIALLAIANYVLTLQIVQRQHRQQHVRYEAATVGPLQGKRSASARLALPFISTVPAIIFALVGNELLRPFFAGSYVVVELLAIASSIGTRLSNSALQRQDAVIGEITYSASYQFIQRSSYLAGSAACCLGLAVATRGAEFAGAALWLGATSLGYFRRARQQARRNAQRPAA